MTQLEINIDEEIKRVQKTLSETTLPARSRSRERNTFYTTVLEGFSENTRNTQKQLMYLAALENSVAIFKQGALKIREEMDIVTLEERLSTQLSAIDEHRQLRDQKSDDESVRGATQLQRKITDGIQFANRYALHFAGHVGLAQLGSEKIDSKKYTFNNPSDSANKDQRSKDRTMLSEQLAQYSTHSLSQFLKDAKRDDHEVIDEDLKKTMEGIFSTWVNQFNWNTWRDVAQEYGLDDLALKYDTFTLKQGDFSKRYNIVMVEKIMDITNDDVVGHDEFKNEILGESLDQLGWYDLKRKENPGCPPISIFVYGEPGMGKTFTSHAAIQTFAQKCRDKGMPFWGFSHSTTDYASSYQNKTANELAKLAQRITDFPGVVVMYLADADTIFQNRKAGLRAEQQNTLSVYMKMFDGSLIPKNGKFMAIMDANYIDGIDDATKSRVMGLTYELKRPQDARTFENILRHTLSEGTDESLKITDEDWTQMGKFIYEDTQLSIRETGHVLKDLKGGFKVPNDMWHASYDEKVAYRNERLAENLTPDRIIEAFASYVETRERIELESERKKGEISGSRFRREEVQAKIEMFNENVATEYDGTNSESQ